MSRWRAVGWAYAACAWALVFGAVSFYWAAGGRLGTETIGPGLTALADDPRFVAFGLWGAGALKVMAGLLALALVRRWGPRTARRLLRAALGGGGLLLIVYGGASWIQHALMLAGAVRVPEALGLTAARWHFVLWDPWWVLGGLLFVLTAWSDTHIRTESGTGHRTVPPVWSRSERDYTQSSATGLVKLFAFDLLQVKLVVPGGWSITRLMLVSVRTGLTPIQLELGQPAVAASTVGSAANMAGFVVKVRFPFLIALAGIDVSETCRSRSSLPSPASVPVHATEMLVVPENVHTGTPPRLKWGLAA